MMERHKIMNAELSSFVEALKLHYDQNLRSYHLRALQKEFTTSMENYLLELTLEIDDLMRM